MHALLCQVPQITRRRLTVRNYFIGVFITQFIKRKVDGLCNAQSFIEQSLRIDMLKYVQRTQVPLAVRIQRKPGVINRNAFAYRRERVLHDPACATVHVHITAGDERHFEPAAFLNQAGQFLALSTIGQ